MGHLAKSLCDGFDTELEDLDFFAVCIEADGMLHKYVVAAHSGPDAVMRVEDETGFTTYEEREVIGPLMTC